MRRIFEFDELPDAIAHRPFGNAELLGNGREGCAAVVLQDPDDGEVDGVEAGG